MMGQVGRNQASQLLHNKFVVVLGDSIQRSVYKDLVLLLQKDAYLTSSQLKSKGELSFENDCLVEGGRLGPMNNGTSYREVRQYRTDHHLVRFYFVTRVFSPYMKSILADFDHGLKPDLIIVNSCVWDVSRYSREWALEYRDNLCKFFVQLKNTLPEHSMVVWNMTMPLGKKLVGGFLVPEIQHVGPLLRFDVIEANFCGATLANEFGFDVLDMHFQFRFSLHLRTNDGVHWNAVAHRKMTCLMLEHAAQAWAVQLSNPDDGKTGYLPQLLQSPCPQTLNSSGLKPEQPRQHNGFGPQFYVEDIPPPFTAGYRSFETDTLGGGDSSAPSWPVNNLVMKQKHRRPYNPYTREKPRYLYKN
ncbi:PC-esterase domain-containing protein 1A [Triplophysa rosa]|uniref:PC-esterase domain-containing protein 1A n=1 Tax=Triplophysa rosa TaxID=992332 RepID=UPI002545F1CB|nr:PC-esterase domain-containing protein 1A [Triplophysa rosa]